MAKLINDKNGIPITEGQKFKFKLKKEVNKSIELIGSFSWNQNELRYEIDIWGDEVYVCLSYVGNGFMYDFEII
jgi:hypothetical protein